LSKANNHPTKNTIPIISKFIIPGTWNFIIPDSVSIIPCIPAVLVTQLINTDAIFSNIFNFNKANTNVADNKVTDSVTKNCITVIPKALLRDFHFNNIKSPVISSTEFTPHLVPRTIDIKLFIGILSVSHNHINAQAIGDHDIVISVIKYDKKKDFVGDQRNLIKKCGSKAFTSEYLIRSNQTNNTIIDINIKNIFIKIFLTLLLNILYIYIIQTNLKKLLLAFNTKKLFCTNITKYINI
jgi:hypothetical protein